tara:strand:- start:909 stop:1721 length:813 start_codon:yes stop_codon:yes gene_type:complete
LGTTCYNSQPGIFNWQVTLDPYGEGGQWEQDVDVLWPYLQSYYSQTSPWCGQGGFQYQEDGIQQVGYQLHQVNINASVSIVESPQGCMPIWRATITPIDVPFIEYMQGSLNPTWNFDTTMPMQWVSPSNASLLCDGAAMYTHCASNFPCVSINLPSEDCSGNTLPNTLATRAAALVGDILVDAQGNPFEILPNDPLPVTPGLFPSMLGGTVDNVEPCYWRVAGSTTGAVNRSYTHCYNSPSQEYPATPPPTNYAGYEENGGLVVVSWGLQ